MILSRADSQSDAELLQGDAADYARFYRRHEDAVLRFFLRRVGPRPDVAADLTAETFARALASRRTFDGALGEPRAWLFGIARHLLARSLERARVEDDARRELGMEPLLVDDAVTASISELADGDAVDALNDLPEDQMLAVAGRVVDELTYAELAARLECSESVVRQRVSRGLRSLRTRLENGK
jgi:RNA polymerase sigma-70 factor (ECF subfamily)